LSRSRRVARPCQSSLHGSCSEACPTASRLVLPPRGAVG
jgi:hypothetical protein